MILGKYNQSKTVYFDLFQVDGIDFEPAATFAVGDIKIMKDEGAEANTTNLPTDEGQGYSLVLTATEMSAARIKLYIVDQTGTKVWLDTSLHLETYGNASAEHAFDLDTASTAQTADHTAGIADIPTVAEFNARTLVAASYFDPATDTVANVTTVATTTTNTDMRGTDGANTATPLTAAGVRSAVGLASANMDTQFTASATATGFNTVAPDNASITAILADTNELQTDDVPTLIAALPTAAEINAEVVDVLETDTHAEPSATVAATASIKDAIMWLKTLHRNKMTQTATTTLLRNDADSATISTSTVSDDGTTFVRGKHV